MNSPTPKRTATRQTVSLILRLCLATAALLPIGTRATELRPSISALTSIQKPKASEPAVIAPKLERPLGQVVIGGGGTFTGVYFTPAKPGEAYLTGDMVGPWHRESKDTPWQLVPVTREISPRPGFGNTGIAIHPTNALIVYADLGNGGAENRPTGLWKSEDGGKTWHQVLQKYSDSNRDINGGGSRRWGPSLAIDPNNPEVVYWGTRRDGVWRTRDGGKNWTQVLAISAGCRNVVVDPSAKLGDRSQRVYIGVFEKGIYASTDGGESFAFDNSFKILAEEKPSITWIRISKDGVVYASHDTHLSRHDQAGWHDISPAGVGKFNSVAVDPEDSLRVLAVRTPPNKPEGELFRSLDGGKTWTIPAKVERKHGQAWDSELPAMLATSAIEIDPANRSAAYVADVYSVWCTPNAWADPVIFETQLNGAEITLTLTLTSAPAVKGQADFAPLFSGVSDIRGFRHTDIFTAPGAGKKGKSFIMAESDWSSYVTSVDFCESDPDVVYAAKSFEAGNHAKILRSTDNGKSWLETTNPLPDAAHAGGKLAVSATEAGRVVYFPGNSQSPFVTTNGGSTWITAKTAGTGEPMPYVYSKNSGYNFAQATGSDRVDGKVFYAYVYRSKTQPGIFWVSRDGGETWSPSKAALPGVNIHDSVSPVQLSPVPGRAGDLWLALGNGGLWHSTDFGSTFTKSPDFPGSRPLLVSAGVSDPCKPGSPPTIYVYGQGTDGLPNGLHVSTNNGQNWKTLPRVGFENLGSYMLMADRQTYGRLYLGTPGLGIWYIQTDQL